MTNLEAADLLDNLIGMVSDNHDSDYDEALRKGRDILKSEPCDDCISRQAVLKAIDVKAWEFCDYLIRNGRNDEQKPVSHFADNLREYVGEELPPVTPQPKTGHWIPVSERLPKWGEEVLTINNDEDYEINHIIDDECNEWFYDNGIVAWMPLPKPYKAESEG